MRTKLNKNSNRVISRQPNRGLRPWQWLTPWETCVAGGTERSPITMGDPHRHQRRLCGKGFEKAQDGPSSVCKRGDDDPKYCPGTPKGPKTSARLLFADFSSAFLSPLLFILYTDDCNSHHRNHHLVKFADDIVLLSLLSGPAQDHGPVLGEFVDWCDSSCLELNVTKTKKMFMAFTKHGVGRNAIIIHGEPVEFVHCHWWQNAIRSQHKANIKKCKQHQYFLRKINSLWGKQKYTQHILQLLHWKHYNFLIRLLVPLFHNPKQEAPPEYCEHLLQKS